MSSKATMWAWEQQIEHSPTKLVLLCLADHSGQDGQAWPSVSRICMLTGLADSTVRNAIIRLEATGFLSKKPRFRENGSMSSNELTLNIGQVVVQVKSFASPIAIECDLPSAIRRTPPPQNGGPPSAIRRTPPPHGGTPELGSIELPIEPTQDKPSKKRARDEIFDTIATTCGIDLTEMNQVNGSMIAKAKQQILQSSPKVTTDEIKTRAFHYRKQWPNVTLTPTALAKHWPTLRPQGSQDTKQQILANMP